MPSGEGVVRPAEAWEGRSAAAWAREWGVPEVRLFRALGSTNEAAREVAIAGAPAGTVVLAEEQWAGRGRAGGAWSSPPGMGVWASMAGPAGAGAPAEPLPLRIGLALARGLEAVAPSVRIGVKWPNDLLVEGRKVAGILCETVWRDGAATLTVAGVGVNVHQERRDFPDGLADRATSLRLAAGGGVDRAAVAGAVVAALARAFLDPAASLPADGLGDHDVLAGREVWIEGDGQRMAGTALGVDPRGGLLLRSRAGVLRTVRSGTVRILEAR